MQKLKQDTAARGWRAWMVAREGTALFVAFVLVALVGGCGTTGPKFDARQPAVENAETVPALAAVSRTNQIQAQWLLPATNLFTLGPGDRIEIELLSDPTTKATTLVGPDGKIYYYLLSGLDVWGLTLGETKALLEKELAKYIKGELRVAVTLRAVESEHVWILGRLNAPGVYPLTAPMTLIEALSRAGGPATLLASTTAPGSAPTARTAMGMTEMADLRRSFLIRQGHMVPVDFQRLLNGGDWSQNIYLQPDDFVYLPTVANSEVHVLGAVALPQPVNYSGSLTLVGAIARAGGTIKSAYLSHVAIVRGSLTEPKIAVVDFKAIEKGTQTDVRLEPQDIVYVPFSPYRTLERYTDLILTTFVRTVGANEGASAVSRGAVPLGINVPIGF